MFLIKPLRVLDNDTSPMLSTTKPGIALLESSTVSYPDRGLTLWTDLPGNRPYEWVRGDWPNWDETYLTHLGGLYQRVLTIPMPPTDPYDVKTLPPGHPDNPAWTLVPYGSSWAPSAPLSAYSTNATVRFPAATYKSLATIAAENPGMSEADRWNLAFVPSFVISGTDYGTYPSGVWERTEEPDDNVARANTIPVLGSKFWKQLEPDRYSPELATQLRQGELTVWNGQIYRKRNSTLTSNEYPSANPTDWALVGACNRWSMFSRSSQEQTRVRMPSDVTPPDVPRAEFVVVLQADSSDLIDAIALLNLEATSVRVQVQDSTLATVYDRTVALEVIGMATPDWYEFLSSPRFYQDKVLLTDIPGTTGARITITITNTDATAACGNCIVGKRVELGISLTNAQVGFTDYSVKTVDEWGNVDVQERGYADRVTLPVDIPNYLLEPLKRTLLQFRATPALYVGSPELPSSIVYGWFKSLEVTIPYPDNSQYSLEIEATS